MVLYRFELICPACREAHDRASVAEDSYEASNRARPPAEQRD